MVQEECPFEAWQLIQAREILKWLTDGKYKKRYKRKPMSMHYLPIFCNASLNLAWLQRLTSHGFVGMCIDHLRIC